ncbi:tetrathionate reductase family octaheme c-type cytochrome [Sansalvadorimonas sp. 2012CJ34-2]|uniref:Tetrathionate reductase family octaheme c-type cytochrome n=1 Tax=Parendozoicomonas callyspongiae TaxID=2942213 RepID=A0ABT0PKV9_9GAMM|nr:tetrathionate reductase family octaheme c-type cytochrome [Sansalvadorimonas sp. 2012CJ34-2]MCL6272014.1 tetrathionate reductase family octaheme c-type cytochrome [Sansalvadorimonas sp. 2012CJ34-2]
MVITKKKSVDRRTTPIRLFITKTSRSLLKGTLAGLLATASLAVASTADHSEFKVLQGTFATGPDVTKACLECHTEAAAQVQKSIHWNWKIDPAKDSREPGKDNIINNFCMAVRTNEARCTSCHAGYGWKDDKFDFTKQENVDCLVCHDTSGEYSKFPTMAGHPNYTPKEWPPKSGKIREPVDLAKVARSVGESSRDNCGSCHFYGGGGDSVKHGDMDSTLSKPSFGLDVHMDADGLNMTCQDCHTTVDHITAGSRITMNARDMNGIDVPGHEFGGRATCESCHDSDPHKDGPAPLLNKHVAKVACQTCHIPEFARDKKTKVAWDWSTAGKSKETLKDEEGNITYSPKKGDFTWQKKVPPEYAWFNGKMNYTLIGDKTEKNAEGVVELVKLEGSAADSGSRIWPFKVMRSVTPRDPETGQMIVPHLFGKDDAAFWKSYDWQKAAAAGMKAVDQPFSGKVEFTKTTYLFPITHMVAPADQALDCVACHNRDNSRMAGIGGIYLPGRDHSEWLDRIGMLLVLMSILAGIGHGLLRYTRRTKGGQL